MKLTNHGISAYRSGYAGVQSSNGTTSARRAPEPAVTQSVRELQRARAEAIDLSKEETNMIERYFPAREEMSLRIYGPGSGANNLNPGSVGGRLDIRG